MKRVRKSPDEPQELADYRRRFALAPASPMWSDFKKDPRRGDPVKNRLRNDQRGLCVYCESVVSRGNESVEHFVPRSAGCGDELAWSNLLLCCLGGETPTPDDVSDTNSHSGPSSRKTCGHAKLGSLDPILNPLGIPAFPRLFRFASGTGAIQSDQDCCAAAGLDVALVERTIEILNLRAGRLNRARQAVLDELLRQFAADAEDPAFSPERSLRIAAEQIPAAGTLPAFFTAIRWFLGQGAERHLHAIDFDG